MNSIPQIILKFDERKRNQTIAFRMFEPETNLATNKTKYQMISKLSEKQKHLLSLAEKFQKLYDPKIPLKSRIANKDEIRSIRESAEEESDIETLTLMDIFRDKHVYTVID